MLGRLMPWRLAHGVACPPLGEGLSPGSYLFLSAPCWQTAPLFRQICRILCANAPPTPRVRSLWPFVFLHAPCSFPMVLGVCACPSAVETTALYVRMPHLCTYQVPIALCVSACPSAVETTALCVRMLHLCTYHVPIPLSVSASPLQFC